MDRPAAGAALALLTTLIVVACATSAGSTPSVTGGPPLASTDTGAGSGASEPALPSSSDQGSDAVEPAFTPIPDASQAPDTGSGAAAGDVPDNAVFLTYRSAAWQFSIQYVEGWQVTTQSDGVVIRDKDSSEIVAVTQLPPDLAAWVRSTDLPNLRSQPGFALVKQNRVRVGSATLIHLVYHELAAPDPVTGKQVPSTVDRFYLPGPGLAVISLSTPDGVDNVDAFRQMIGSFTWAKG